MNTELRKKQIIQNTLDIIGYNGISGLTIAKIAEKTQVSEAALYRHFTSKEEILSNCIQFIKRQLLSTIQDVVKEDSRGIEKLEKIFNIHLDHIQKNRGVPKIIYTSEIHSNELLRSSVYEVIFSYTTEIESIIYTAIKNGELPDSIDIVVEALNFISLIQFTVFRLSLTNFDKKIISQAKKQWVKFLDNLQNNKFSIA